MIILCAVLRVVPHPPNLAPVGATAVLAGRTMPRWLAIVTVLVAMFVGDVLLAWTRGYPIVNPTTPFVYAGFAIQALLGRALVRRRGGAIAAAVLGACAFFVISNVGLWLTSDFYPHTSAGLSTCFVAAIPYFERTLVGDVAWTVALSLVYVMMARRLETRRNWLLVPTRDVAAV
jgi:hypothetical protein